MLKWFLEWLRRNFEKSKNNFRTKKIVKESKKIQNKDIVKKYEVIYEDGEEVSRTLIEQVDTVNKEKKGILTKILVVKKKDIDNKLKTSLYKKSKVSKNDGKVKQEDITLNFKNGKKISETCTKIFKDLKKHITKKDIKIIREDRVTEKKIEYKDGKIKSKKEIHNGVIETAIGKYEFRLYKVNDSELKLSEYPSFVEFMKNEHPEIDYENLSSDEKKKLKDNIVKFTVKLDKCSEEHGKKYLMATGQNPDDVKVNVRKHYEKINEILEQRKIEIDTNSVVMWNNKGIKDGEEDGDDGYVISLLEDLLKQKLFEEVVFIEEKKIKQEVKKEEEKDKFLAELLDVSGIEDIINESLTA